MTFDEKCFIEPSDIVAVHYECGHCHAAIVIPTEKLNPDQIGAIAVRLCPHCQTPSGFQPGTAETNSFLQFNIYLKEIANVLQGHNLKIRLDIKCSD